MNDKMAALASQWKRQLANCVSPLMIPSARIKLCLGSRLYVIVKMNGRYTVYYFRTSDMTYSHLRFAHFESLDSLAACLQNECHETDFSSTLTVNKTLFLTYDCPITASIREDKGEFVDILTFVQSLEESTPSMDVLVSDGAGMTPPQLSTPYLGTAATMFSHEQPPDEPEAYQCAWRLYQYSVMQAVSAGVQIDDICLKDPLGTPMVKLIRLTDCIMRLIAESKVTFSY